jgi:membrane-bound metal-dependent hydrolase YbcI (DUF457 family)
MALCFAHSTAGYLAYEAVRPAGAHRAGLLVAAVVLANAPDVDFLPGIVLGQPGAFHRGVTHTVAAVLVVAALSALVLRARPGWWRATLWATAVYTSHLLLDFFTVDRVAPYGARFLWPLSDAYWIAPVTLLPEIVIDPSGRTAFFASLVARHTAAVWAQELGVLVLAVGAVHALRAGLPRVAWRRVAEEP